MKRGKKSEQALLDLLEPAHFEAHSVVACPGQELSFNAQQILYLVHLFLQAQPIVDHHGATMLRT